VVQSIKLVSILQISIGVGASVGGFVVGAFVGASVGAFVGGEVGATIVAVGEFVVGAFFVILLVSSSVRLLGHQLVGLSVRSSVRSSVEK